MRRPGDTKPLKFRTTDKENKMRSRKIALIFTAIVLLVALLSVSTCVVTEYLYSRITRSRNTAVDGSAMVTGLLLAMTLPHTVPYWLAAVGTVFSIVVVKCLCGGLGENIFNPALAARAFLFSWPVSMSTWIKVGWENQAGLLGDADIVTAATPLAAMHQGLLPEESILAMFQGYVGGCIGETSALLLLIGFGYLLVRKVISPRIPLTYILTVAVLTFLFPQGNDRIAWMMAQIFGGGLMLGAIFMATDYVTSPVTKLGQLVYAAGCGVLTVMIRYFGGYNEGVSYAILIMNCCVFLIEKISQPVKFGFVKPVKAEKEAAK